MRRHPNNFYQIGDAVRLIPGMHPVNALRTVVDYYTAASVGTVCNINGEGVFVQLENKDRLWCRYYAIEPSEPVEPDFDCDDLFELMEAVV